MLDGKLESFTPKVQYEEKLLVGEYLGEIIANGKIATTVQATSGKIARIAGWIEKSYVEE